jgi:DNA-directed RNA polymerase beta' subunit
MPVVKPGDVVKPNQLLAKSNYTDNNGTLAMGINARTVFLPLYGKNHMDAISISQSFAKRLTSQHMYTYKVDWADNMKQGKKLFQGAFPGEYTKKQLDTIADDGVIKPGTTVRTGDPLILRAEVNTKPVSRVHKKNAFSFANAVVEWDHHDPGIVTDVFNSPKGATVLVKSLQPHTLASKISNRYGGKGIVGHIVPDELMPMTPDGPAEVVYTTISNIGRINYGMIHELLLGRIAKKLGHPIKIESFDPNNPDTGEYVRQLARKYGISGREIVTDPTTGKPIKGLDGKGVSFGYSYIQKLHHTAEYKESSRGFGAYTQDEQPAQGGDEGAKRFALMHTNAILSHGAYNVAHDARRIRGQKNDEFWAAFMRGYQPPAPKQPAMYDKFLAHLNGSGINVQSNAGRLQILALTNHDVETLTGDREVQSSETILWEKDKKPIKGGLFDPAVFGEYGNQWGYIKPVMPVLNPVLESAACKLLGITQKKLMDVLSAKEDLGNFGTGIEGVRNALKAVKVDEAIRDVKNTIENSTGQKRDAAVKRYAILKGCRDTGVRPEDWILDKIPVIPPKFRPVSEMAGTGTPLVADVNYLYVQLINHNNAVKQLQEKIGDVANESAQLYKYYREITGLADPSHPKLVQKRVKGLLRHVFGDGSSKFGMVQRSLFGGTTDLTGLAVIAPDPELDIDTVGLPVAQAFDLYRPFVIRKLVQRGYPVTQAVELWKQKAPAARNMLLEATKERPVIVNRAPILQKYGIMAFFPKLTQSDILKINPLLVGGFAADYDGNCCDYDTEIFIRLSKSITCMIKRINKMAYTDEENCYPQNLPLFISQLKEAVMAHHGETAVSALENGQVVSIKIGMFPKVGEPVKDKNGADVFLVPEGIEVLSYHSQSGKQLFRPVTSYTVERNVSCAKVTTSGGRFVIVSDNESLVVYNPKDDILYKSTPQQAIGKLVPVVKQRKQFGNQYSRNIGWFYGALISDGWITSRTVGYSKVDTSKRRFFESVARNEIEPNFIRSTYAESAHNRTDKLANSIKIHLNGIDLVQKLLPCTEKATEENKDKRSALRKCIPPELLQNGTRECLLGLLAGLLEGDGTLTWNHSLKTKRAAILFSTSSKRLTEDLRLLGARLGFSVSVSEMPPRGFSNTAYTVCPCIHDMWVLFKDMKFVSESAQQFQKEFLELEEPHNNADLVPVPLEEAKEATSILGGARNLPVHIRTARSAFSRAAKDGYLSRRGAAKYLQLLPDNACPQLRKYTAATDITWERYKTAEPVEARDVYDISVDGTKVFVIGNGLVVYDTMNFFTPVTDEAVKEAIELMLPSRNLISVTDNKSPMPMLNEDQFIGVAEATRDNPLHKHGTRVFATKQDVIRAFRRGDISVYDKIKVLQD